MRGGRGRGDAAREVGTAGRAAVRTGVACRVRRRRNGAAGGCAGCLRRRERRVHGRHGVARRGLLRVRLADCAHERRRLQSRRQCARTRRLYAERRRRVAVAMVPPILVSRRCREVDDLGPLRRVRRRVRWRRGDRRRVLVREGAVGQVGDARGRRQRQCHGRRDHHHGRSRSRRLWHMHGSVAVWIRRCCSFCVLSVVVARRVSVSLAVPVARS